MISPKKTTPPRATSGNGANQRRRYTSQEREQQIIARATDYFAAKGFTGNTRDLASEIGVTQPLLYRYFSSKQALIDRVYQEVYANRWNPEWEEMLADRSVDFAERLRVYSRDYARSILNRNWIRIFIFAGLAEQGIHARYIELLRKRIFVLILRETSAAFGVPEPKSATDRELALERIWGWHCSIFYLGVRKWIYGMPLPADLDQLVDQRVSTFLDGFPSTLSQDQTSAGKTPKASSNKKAGLPKKAKAFAGASIA